MGNKPEFELFHLKLQTLSLDEKNLKFLMANQFLHCAAKQTKKHNEWYAKTRSLLHACFAEHSSSKFVAHHILRHATQHSQGATENILQPFFSKIHQKNIDPELLINFLTEETRDTIEEIRSSGLIAEFRDTLLIIANGGDTWDQTNPEMEKHWHKVLHCFAAQSANQQNNERFVKATAHLKKTGKCEQKANIYGIALNGFCTEVTCDDFSVDDHSDANDENSTEEHSWLCKCGITKGQKRCCN